MSDTAVNLLDDELSVDSVEEYPAEGQPGGLFDTQQIDNDDEDSTSYQTVMMTVLFTTLMVLYIGFCVYYRRVKTRSSVGDLENLRESERRRRQQRRENQEVLNESTSATTRARDNAAEQAKLEERKKNINDALLLCLIVDDDDDDKEEETEEVACSDNCNCEKCQYWNWDCPPTASTTAEESLKSEEDDQEEEEVASTIRGLVTIQEEEEDSDDEVLESTTENTVAVVAAGGDAIDIEAQHSNTGSSPEGSQRADSQLSPPPSSSRLSLSSKMMCTDALTGVLSCGGNSDALNCGGNATRVDRCGSSVNGKLNCSIHRRSTEDNSGDATTTISLSTIVSTYGMECNICLSHFQVGDCAATAATKESGCTHVFHKECISRWLLVRDCCPICRRSYFPEDETASPDDADLESGMANDVITEDNSGSTPQNEAN